MTLTIERASVRLLFLLRLSLDVRKGTWASGLVERIRGGKKQPAKGEGGDAEFKPRPNIYSWCFADDGMCVAQGTSGSVAVWKREGA